MRSQMTSRIASLDELQGDQKTVSPGPLCGWRDLPLQVLEREEVRNLFQQAVKMLPNTDRQVFLLRDVERLNVTDTAQILGISASLVKRHCTGREWRCKASSRQD